MSYRDESMSSPRFAQSGQVHHMTGDYGDELEDVSLHSVVHGTVVDAREGEIIVQINGAKFEGKVTQREISQLPEDLQQSLQEEGHSRDFFVQYMPRQSKRDQDQDELPFYTLTITGLWRNEDWQLAEKSLRSGDTFTTTPVRSNKGGLLVRFGQVEEGFIPLSHLWNFPSSRDPKEREEILREWVREGHELLVKVIEVNRDKHKLVLSNRLAEQERNAEVQRNRLATLKVGDVVKGTVRNIRDFGAFVDIGGIEGLLHISEIDWDLVRHPSDHFSEGDVLDVKILHIDMEKNRIKLSLKALTDTPWQSVESRYKTGDIVWVDITKKKQFGVFAKLEAGVEGLIHISQIAPKSESDPLSTIQEGDRVEVEILRIDAANQRISLSRANVLGDYGAPALEGSYFGDEEEYDSFSYKEDYNEDY